MANWKERFIGLALEVATWSKDQNTCVGAIIADDSNRILTVGYNGFPEGVDDNIQERYERPLKYKWTEHADRNALYNAARNGVAVEGSTMYLGWIDAKTGLSKPSCYPCCDCARGIINSGIKRVVCDKPNFNHKNWGEDFVVVQTMFEEAGVEVVYYN